MVGASTWFRYLASKLDYSVSLSRKGVTFTLDHRGHQLKHLVIYGQGKIADNEILDAIWRNLLQGKLTFLHCNKDEEMAPMCLSLSGTLLVRKIPAADPRRVHVGDVVVLNDPIDTRGYIVRRLAAVGGHEMVSDDRNDAPFVLEKDQCWVLADNKTLKPMHAYDRRTFGPVTMEFIVGRVLYCLRNAVDHGPVYNSLLSTKQDSAVIEVELDIAEMAKNHKA